MKFLESFPEKTREEKSQFMKGLPRILNQFPERVIKRKVQFLLSYVSCVHILNYSCDDIDIAVITGRTQKPPTPSLHYTQCVCYR